MSDFHVRDQRKPGHHWADNEVLDDFGPKIGAYGYAVYMFLGRFAGNNNGRCSKTLNEISAAFKISQDTVQRSISCLEENGLIHIEKSSGKPSVFILLEVPKRPTAHSGECQVIPTAHSGMYPPLTAVPPPLTAVANKEVILLQDLNPYTRNPNIGKKQVPSANDLEPQDAERATVELLGVSGYTAMAARDAVGSVKRRKPKMRFTEIPEYIVNLWQEVKFQPRRAIPSLKTFLNEIGNYMDSDHWKIKKTEFKPQIDWQGGHVSEDGTYMNKHGKKVPGFICPPKPKQMAGD